MFNKHVDKCLKLDTTNTSQNVLPNSELKITEKKRKKVGETSNSLNNFLKKEPK